MHAGRSYSLTEITLWTRRETVVFLVVAALPKLLDALGLQLPALPWAPLAIVGTAVAFLTGFKGNAAYGRLWEARQIWGGIVNSSRTWAIAVLDYVSKTDDGGTRRALVHRHLAWLVAMRYQLREPRVWETMNLPHQIEYRARTYTLPEAAQPLEAALAEFLEPDELARVLAKKNRATHVLALQSAALRRLADDGALTELRHIEMMTILSTLYDHQGRCERIKNFPYPRQYATLNLIFVWMFIVLLPFALHPEFRDLGPVASWLSVPLGALIAWVFHTMDKIGSTSENPFEGGPDDGPITAMSRGIEIDLLEMIDAPQVPAAIGPIHAILM
ncbi:MAG: multidrug transporter [Deltaproteobacteria bacterium]|nr:multidrug transporter [Deltaproteobacteria bacterium]